MNSSRLSNSSFKRRLAHALSALAILALALASTGSLAQARQPAVPGSPLQGFHDGNSGTVDPPSCTAFGWAVNPLHPDVQLNIRVLADGAAEPVAQRLANDYGSDMDLLGLCTGGNCRFTVNLDQVLAPRVMHEIRVQAYDPDTAAWWDLEATPKYLTCSPVLPTIRVSVSNNYLRADNFAPSTELTFRVYASADPYAQPAWSDVRTTDGSGFAIIWPWENTPDLVPGNYVVVTNGNEQKELLLEDLTVDSFDPLAGTAAGTAPLAPDGRWVWLWAGNDSGGCGTWAHADPLTGAWTADLHAASCYPSLDMWAAAELYDDNGDGTVFEKGPDPTTFTVNATDDEDDGACDAGHCSLREAIHSANIHIAADTIAFDLPGDPPFTIRPASPLPGITDTLSIDATTQPGYDGAPLVELDGSDAGDGANALDIGASDSAVRGLVINRFSGAAILLAGSNDIIEDNYLGTDTSGSYALPNGDGFTISGPDSGSATIRHNLISGNANDGLRLDSSDNVLQANLIGTDVTGAAPLGNGGRGVNITEGAANNLIGGTSAEARNVISANGAAGIRIGGAGATGNTVQGNYIGTDSTGQNALGNGYVGIRITEGASLNFVGGPEVGAGNLISANMAEGVLIDGEAVENVVQGNLLGTNADGSSILSAAAPGLPDFTLTAEDVTCPAYPVDTSFDNFVAASEDPVAPWSGTPVIFQGTDDCTDRETWNGASLIYRYKLQFPEPTRLYSLAVTGAAFNGPDNVLRVLDSGLNELAVSGTNGGNSHYMNYVQLPGLEGTVFYVDEFDTSTTWRYRESIVINGPAPLGNLSGGVRISGARDNAVGGPGAGNLLSGNFFAGVVLLEPGTTGNFVQGNRIGTDLGGTQALGQWGFGVVIGDGAANNTIGGPDPGVGNLVSGNANDGIALWRGDTTGNTVQGNTVGTDLSGAAPLPNNGTGIWLGDGVKDTLLADNLVSSNGFGGISINAPETTGTRIERNTVGTDRHGASALPNGGPGIYNSASQTTILSNLISGNNGIGIQLQDGASGNVIQGNTLGTDAARQAPLPNAYAGIWLNNGASNNLIGGTQPGAGNLIAHHEYAGIAITEAGTSNSILSNSIYSNGDLGIDLGWDLVTLNDPRDRDAGPNQLQNYPVLSRPKLLGDQLRLAGSLFSNPNDTYRIEFFSVPQCDPLGNGEGQLYLGAGQVSTGPSGLVDFSFLLPSQLQPGQFVTATATDSAGNTSEFSTCAGPLK